MGAILDLTRSQLTWQCRPHTKVVIRELKVAHGGRKERINVISQRRAVSGALQTSSERTIHHATHNSQGSRSLHYLSSKG
uniref:Uncharacterized protein n=1 Tax=Timema shepardi TaxID=629360 RepID=A0A7R9AZF8_TIMSH|nr:unnamed protein product [Timema shepardi]